MRILLDTHVFLWFIFLVAQAQRHDMAIATVDPLIQRYDVTILT